MIYGFWLYSNKFLGMSADYITSMSRSIVVNGNQANLSFYPIDKLMLYYGGTILLCFLLIQNEFRDMAKAIGRLPRYLRGEEQDDFDWSTIATSLFGILAYLVCYFILVNDVFGFKPGTQVPFFFLGGALVAGILLLQDNIQTILGSIYREVIGADFGTLPSRMKSSLLKPEGFGMLVSVLSILLFANFTVNMPMYPFITNDIPAFLSLATLVVAISWTVLLSREGAKPSVQAKRTSALAFFVIFPFISYLFLRLIFLQNDGTNATMLNRWEVRFDFMEKVNTFKINPWPMEAEPNQDSRWVFLKAAIINSGRVTLVSIFLCTILGVIVGVTRLSANKLASTAATVYVEVFRNLPLAVLLFLISSQMGAQLPYFIDEYSIGEVSRTSTDGCDECITSEALAYVSNEGTWVVNFGSYLHVMVGVALLMLVRVGLRFQDRVEPRKQSAPTGIDLARRPFSPLGWRAEPLAADIFLIFSLFLCVFTAMPFLATDMVGPDQTLRQIASSFIPTLATIALVIYAFFVNTSIDDEGMNNLEIDDTDAGLRRRFTIWVGAVSVALAIALAGGVSWPEYNTDIYEPIGTVDPPGSWDIMEGTGFEMTPAFLAMMLGLTLFTTSVVAEIVRGSIQSLPRGQVEAAISLSLNPFQRLRLVILPQALRSMVPLLNNQYMNVWKNSSLAVVVAYTDIFYVILVMMNNVGKLVPLFLLLLVTYQAGSLTISAIMNWYNSRVTSVKI
ncbi:MAG: ABC transporter permease subunit [Candidatus Thermoplasmatota archaeon]|nr:ABC transporter permease subunit [Candidatus Thermoplasmatota archaeon]